MSKLDRTIQLLQKKLGRISFLILLILICSVWTYFAYTSWTYSGFESLLKLIFRLGIPLTVVIAGTGALRNEIIERRVLNRHKKRHNNQKIYDTSYLKIPREKNQNN